MEPVKPYRLPKLKRCIMCGAEKSRVEFYSCAYTTRQGKRSQRSESRCMPCARARRVASYRSGPETDNAASRAYKAKNYDALNAKAATYRAENLEKVRLGRRISEQKRRAGGNLDKAESRRLIERVLDEARFGDRYLDAYSGNLISDPEVDHIVPISRGGQHIYENLCVTSGRNNRSKNATPMLIWILRNE